MRLRSFVISPFLTENGIQRLAALRGNFRETDIVVNFYFPPSLEESPTTEDLAIISDGFQCLHVLNETNTWSDDARWIDHYAVVRIRRAMFCPYGDGTLLVSPEFMEVLSSHPIESHIFPQKVFKHENTQNADIHVPLIALPYFGTKFDTRLPAIRGLVTFKSRLHDPYFDNKNTPFFVIHIEDESLEVQLYAEGEVAIELYDRFEEGHIYRIEHFSRKSTHSYFYNLPIRSKDGYGFTNATYIEECPQEEKLPLKLSFNFVPIPAITKLDSTSLPEYEWHHIDVLGIVHSVGPLKLKGNQYFDIKIPRREITVVDQSGCILPVTLWSYRAVEFDIKPLTIVALRHVRVQRDTTPGVSVLSTSTIHVEPDGVEEVYALRQWFNQAGSYLFDSSDPMDSKMLIMCDSDTAMVVD